MKSFSFAPIVFAVVFLLIVLAIVLVPLISENNENRFEFREYVLADRTYYGVTSCILGEGQDTVVIPSTYKGNPVTHIESDFTCVGVVLAMDVGDVEVIRDGGFDLISMLKSVNLRNVRIIGRSAFRGCINLNSVVVPATVEEVHAGALYQCEALTEVFFEGNPEIIEDQSISPDAVIYGPAEGTVREYAEKHGNSFVVWEKPEQTEDAA